MVLVVREFVKTCDLSIHDPLNTYTQLLKDHVFVVPNCLASVVEVTHHRYVVLCCYSYPSCSTTYFWALK